MMKLIMKKVASLVLAASLVVSGVYCGSNDAKAAPKAKKIVMNKKSVTVSVGGKFTLKVKKVTPKKASKAVTYKVRNKKVATVSKKGVIKGKKVGSTKITVTSKKNKKVKATVKVKVIKRKAPTQAPVVPTPTAVVPVPSAPAATSAAPVASATPAKTTKPVKTQRPAATATPTPTAPPDLDDRTPSAPYKLNFSEEIIELQGDGVKYTINKDGSITLTNTVQYNGIAFKLPKEVENDCFDTVTIKYKDVKNVGAGWGCGLWRLAEDKDTESVMSYEGVFASKDENDAPITSGEYVASLKNPEMVKAGNTWYVTRVLLFHNDTSVHELTPPAQVVIESMVFSHSQYDGPARPGDGVSGPAIDVTGPAVDVTGPAVDVTPSGIDIDLSTLKASGTAEKKVNDDGSVTFTNADGFDGAYIPLGKELKAGEKATVRVEYEYTGETQNARLYLVKDGDPGQSDEVKDAGKPNSVEVSKTVVHGEMTVKDGGTANTVHLKVYQYGNKFKSLTVKKVTVY